MPIYEYRCMKCDKDFEYLVFGSDHSAKCPDCNTKDVERLMSACSFKSSGGSYSPSMEASSSGCSSCSSGNCSTCH